MNWPTFLPIVLVLGVAFIFIWRDSGRKKHVHGDNCGCAHAHGADAKKENSAPR